MSSSTQAFRHVFIGGAPRSGTTMLGSMLGSHSQMLATPESQFKFEMSLLTTDTGANPKKLIAFLEGNERFRFWNFKPDWNLLDYTNHSTLINSLVHQYGQKTGKPDFSYWIDHTPVNLRHGQLLDTAYPGCYFIHIIRDGRAVMASQLKVLFGSKDPVFAALKWMEAICAGFACETAFPERCLRVHYEQLVLQPEIQLRKICQFLDVPYEEGMIIGDGFEVPAYTKAQHQLVGKAPDVSRIEDWKQTLSEHDIQLFESMTFDILPMLGYDKRTPGFVAKPKEMKQAWILFNGAMQYLFNKAVRRKIKNRKYL